jgi:uncharacterized protein (TIGR03086 family)
MELTLALHSTLDVLRQVRRGDLEAATPCAAWDVRALINHFVGTARWWAASVAGDGTAGIETGYANTDFVAAYEESIKIALVAFEADGALAKTVRLPMGEFAGIALRGLAATEQFTHGWDLARAIGRPTDLAPDLAMVLLDGAKAAISDEYRGPDGEAFFGPARTAPAGASAADRLAAFLGRTV